jgi:hypothetical protein
MTSIEIVKLLSELLRKSSNHRFDGGESVMFSFNGNKHEIEESLLHLNIRFDAVGTSDISINLRQFSSLFYDRDHFLRESTNQSVFTSNVGILFYTPDTYLFYESTTGSSYINSDIDTADNFIENTRYYLRFYSLFDTLGISEYDSSTNHEFILVDPEKGKFLLGYPVIPPSFQAGINLKDKYAKFEKMNDRQEFRLLFKRQIIESLARFDHDQKLPKLVENIETIIRDTENNYEVFLRKFNFDELKKNFRKERDEYFEQVRDIVERLLSKVVSIPISVSAAAITIYNLKDDPNYLVIVIVSLAYVAYSIFTSFLLRLLHLDSLEINRDLNNDLQIIAKSSNIPPDILEKESSKVYKKIYILNNTIATLQILLCATSLAVLIVSFTFFTLPIKYIILMAIFVLALQLLVSWWGIKKIQPPRV